MKTTLYNLIFLLIMTSITLSGQQITPIVFDLNAPIDINLDNQGNLWVTDAGTGANDGAVVRVLEDQTTEVIIEGLPSFFNPTSQELQGPLSTQMMDDGTIYVIQGAGPDTLSASILAFHINDYESKNEPLSPADRRSRIAHGNWVLANGFMESNPYSFVIDADGNFVIADAAANAVIRYNSLNQSFEVLAELPLVPNPIPVGPPFIEAVPTKILADPEGGYLISTLTGFPFLDGFSNIYHLAEDGALTIHASDLTMVTDMEVDPDDGQLLALQFAATDSMFSFQFNSAQLIKINGQSELDTLVSGFGPSPGLALGENRTAYVTHLFLGQVLKIDWNPTSVKDLQQSILPIDVFPNPSAGDFSVHIYNETSGGIQAKLFNKNGQLLYHENLGYFSSGNQTIQMDVSRVGMPSGSYILQLQTETTNYFSKIILQ